jgi:hypothetical protein
MMKMIARSIGKLLGVVYLLGYGDGKVIEVQIVLVDWAYNPGG